MASTEATPSPVPADKAALEQQYMHLLELRIAQLETLVKSANDKVKTAAADSSDTDGATHSKEGEKDEKDKSNAPENSDKKDDEKKSDDESAEKEAETPRARVRQVLARLNRDTYDYDDEEPTKITDSTKAGDSSKKDGDKQDPILFRSYTDEEVGKKITNEMIEIATPELKRLYNDITGTEPAASQEGSSSEDTSSRVTPLTLYSPFKLLLVYWEQFEAACEASDDDDEKMALARQDLKQLLALVQSSQAERCLKDRATFLPKGSIPFDYLWTIFQPGTKVCAKTFLNDHQILEVRSCSTPSEHYKWTEDMRVQCMGFDWDGTKFSPFEYTFVIDRNNEGDKKDKEVQINTLDVYPLSFHKDEADLRRKLIKRGEKFWTMCKPGKFQYDYAGVLMANKPSQFAKAQMLSTESKDDDTVSTFSGLDESGNAATSKKEYAGQIIVDAYSFLRTQDDLSDGGPALGVLAAESYNEAGCKCQACRLSPLVAWDRLQRRLSQADLYESFGKINDPQNRFLMCPPRVLGYALKGKTWSQFRLLDCKEVHSGNDERKNYFGKQLQLDPEYKKMLMAFVNSHQSSRPNDHNDPAGTETAVPRSLDVIEGKGKGLAILLHGPPGVGKTLTVETIALATGRPLLVVSVAEIGTRAANAESRLNVFFAMAARWGAILLIDEADVFLEERVKTDNPERNMLVSVLLRSLEYYEGIIFLTTNRIRSIDVAVQSRMHLAIQYKSLTQKQKLAIYTNLLNKLDDKIIKGDRDAMYDRIKEDLCRRNEMNGRQIRNIVTAALALARDKAKGSDGEIQLRFDHLRKVHETTTDFLHSLKDTTSKARQRNEAAAGGDEDESD